MISPVSGIHRPSYNGARSDTDYDKRFRWPNWLEFAFSFTQQRVRAQYAHRSPRVYEDELS